MSDGHDNHGSTPAAWTLTVLVALGFLVSTVGLVIGQWPIFWVGAALVLLGGIAGWVMKKAGLGKPQTHQGASASA